MILIHNIFYTSFTAEPTQKIKLKCNSAQLCEKRNLKGKEKKKRLKSHGHKCRCRLTAVSIIFQYKINSVNLERMAIISKVVNT